MVDNHYIEFLPARRILCAERAEHAEILLRVGSGQATTRSRPECTLAPGGSLLLDFGIELHGGLRIVSGSFTGPNPRLKITFGESASETFSEPDYGHALQQGMIELPRIGTTTFGELGFRFARIENLEKERSVGLQEVMAVFQQHRRRRLAEFECSDPLLNQIWETSVYTLELCLQNFAWDGIKRDRLVWMGDLYPELLVAGYVFGRLPVIENSLDFLRRETPLPEMMNGSWTYSIWWILGQHAWYRMHGNRKYLEEQREYLTGLLKFFMSRIQSDGHAEICNGWALLDWATGTDSEAAPAILAGNHALLLIALRRGADLCRILEENDTAKSCEAAARQMAAFLPPLTASTAANALQVLAGLRDAKEVYNQCFAGKLPEGLSTFLGCFVLDACILAGQRQQALDCLRQYWGGMLQLGATTFWEHFDISWMQNAARIDELPAPGKRDVHRECGEGCFRSFRHSLCHGWAALPAVWLQRHVLGISLLDAGRISIAPQLCDLSWARGTAYTPYGLVKIEARPGHLDYSAPPEIHVEQQDCSILL
ncbi:MAG: alpha-L-rhamnosidase [Lentisphaerae bacterium]|nr:alpha-L-rhamnosidase [Lentisphaerota bacterium]